jgi:hypothetical protein
MVLYTPKQIIILQLWFQAYDNTSVDYDLPILNNIKIGTGSYMLVTNMWIWNKE